MTTSHRTPRRTRLIDLTGRRFGRLVVLRRDANRGLEVTWLCQCDCGESSVVRSACLRKGTTTSCGCYHRQIAGRHLVKHRACGTRAYRAWADMKTRCGNPNRNYHANYGGRGIAVAPEWQEDFEAFHAHVGDPPGEGYTIERKNVDRGYEPGNVRWATPKEQARNTRRNVFVATRTEVMCETAWAERLGVVRSSFRILSRRVSALAAFARAGLSVVWFGRIGDAPPAIRAAIEEGITSYARPLPDPALPCGGPA